jgi:hypothetical protein
MPGTFVGDWACHFIPTHDIPSCNMISAGRDWHKRALDDHLSPSQPAVANLQRTQKSHQHCSSRKPCPLAGLQESWVAISEVANKSR